MFKDRNLTAIAEPLLFYGGFKKLVTPCSMHTVKFLLTSWPAPGKILHTEHSISVFSLVTHKNHHNLVVFHRSHGDLDKL